MTDIYLYDFEFNLLCVEKHCISSYWSENYDDLGSFEAVFPLNSSAIETIMNHRYVIAVQGVNQAIVTGKIISKKGTIYGKSLNWILTKRLINPNTFSKDAYENAKDIINEAFSDVENFEVKNHDSIGEKEFTLSKRTNALEAIKKCLNEVGMGHRISINFPEKKWVFEIISKSETQIVMSEDTKNAYNVEYAEDIQNLFTDGIYTDEDDESHDITSEMEGIYKWTCDLSSKTEEDAKFELTDKKINTQSRAMTREFEYQKDFKLGDKVKIRKTNGNWENLIDAYIYGVNIWYDADIYGCEPIFKEI